MERQLKVALENLTTEIKKVNQNVLMLGYLIFQDIQTESSEEAKIKSEKLQDFEDKLNIKQSKHSWEGYLG